MELVDIVQTGQAIPVCAVNGASMSFEYPSSILYRSYFLFAAVVWCSPIGAFAQQTAPNGCGSGWSVYFVPNSIPLLNCRFEQACNVHDDCYGKCEGKFVGDCEYRRCRPGGDLDRQRSILCVTEQKFLELGAKATARRNSCDTDFYRRVRALNMGRKSCEAFAVIYRDAVKYWGGPNFSGADQFDGSPQPKSQYEGAIRQFFEKGTEEQFRRIVEADDAGGAAVNMRKPLRFDRSRGLVNE